MKSTPDAGPACLDLVGEQPPLHLRHDDIGEQQIDRAVAVTEDLQGLRAVRGRQHLVAVTGEDLPGGLAQRERGLMTSCRAKARSWRVSPAACVAACCT